MFHGINVVSIPVGDLTLAKYFYGEVLELGEPVYDLPDAGWIEFGSGGNSGNIAVTTADADRAGHPGVTLVFDVSDCVATVDRLRAKGVRCDDPVTFPGFVVFASFYDPFGNRLQMASPA
jgi:predicted enzyme related to lactoylglutathione lyase